MLEIQEIKELSLPLLEKLVALEKGAFGQGGLNHWTLPIMVKYGKVFAFKKEGEIQGLAELIRDWRNPRHAFLVGLSIKRGQRGKGLGKTFLKEILKRVRAEGVCQVILTVSPKNTSALKLYQELGFQKIKFCPQEYGKGEHRLILETNLVPRMTKGIL